MNILKGTTATYTENVLVTTPVTLAPGGKGSIAQITLVGNLSFGVGSGGGLQMDANSPYVTAGVDYDQLIVNGNVDFTNGALSITGGGPAVTPTQRLTLISVPSGVTTPGTNPGQFASVTLGSNTFVLSYKAGVSGNDVALLLPVTITITGGPFAFDGTAHAATVTVSPGNIAGSLNVQYSGTVIFPGTYTVTATFVPDSIGADLNYGNTTATGTVVVLATPLVSSFTITGLPPTAISGSPFLFTVTARDSSNNVLTGYTGTVHFSSATDPLAVLPSNSFLSNGTGTFVATLKTAGSQTIKVSDVATGVSTTSPIILVNPTATHLQVTASPTTVGAGIAFVLTVTAVDSGGNTVTSDNDVPCTSRSITIPWCRPATACRPDGAAGQRRRLLRHDGAQDRWHADDHRHGRDLESPSSAIPTSLSLAAPPASSA